MLKTQNKLFKTVLFLNMVFAFACIAANIYTVITPGKSSSMAATVDLCTLISLIAALYYIFMGYKKNAARYFKFFTLFFAASALCNIIFEIIENMGVLVVTCYVILFFLTLGITFIKDLGKAKSVAICGLAITAAAIALVAFLAATLGSGATYTGAYAIAIIIRAITQLVLSVMLLIMVYAKYFDKAMRGKPQE